MEKKVLKIAFDIDGTLQGTGNNVSQKAKWLHRELLKFAEMGHDIIVWSGGGVPYAQWYINFHKLPARTCMKCSEEVDIAFDDAVARLRGANITIQVPGE